jgi:hypothetical protein
MGSSRWPSEYRPGVDLVVLSITAACQLTVARNLIGQSKFRNYLSHMCTSPVDCHREQAKLLRYHHFRVSLLGDCTGFVGGVILNIVYFGVALYLVDSEFGISLGAQRCSSNRALSIWPQLHP